MGIFRSERITIGWPGYRVPAARLPSDTAVISLTINSPVLQGAPCNSGGKQGISVPLQPLTQSSIKQLLSGPEKSIKHWPITGNRWRNEAVLLMSVSRLKRFKFIAVFIVFHKLPSGGSSELANGCNSATISDIVSVYCTDRDGGAWQTRRRHRKKAITINLTKFNHLVPSTCSTKSCSWTSWNFVRLHNLCGLCRSADEFNIVLISMMMDC